jgi:hypothetical protein
MKNYIKMLCALVLLFTTSCAGLTEHRTELLEDEYGFYVTFAATHHGVVQDVVVNGITYKIITDIDGMGFSASTIIGDPVIKDHSLTNSDACIGRIIYAFVGTDARCDKDALFVVAKITDRDAIEKIKNWTYYKVSVNFTVISSMNFAMGEKTVVMIPFLVEFHELSIVNIPADRDARAVATMWGTGNEAIEFSERVFSRVIHEKIEDESSDTDEELNDNVFENDEEEIEHESQTGEQQ